MRYYIKSSYRATLKAFRSEDIDGEAWEELENIDAHNEAILTEVYNKILTGVVDYATQQEAHTLYSYTRSTRTGEIVRTAFWKRNNGELSPAYHTEYHNVSELLKASEYIAGYITLH